MTKYEELKASKTESEMAAQIISICENEPWSTFENYNCKGKGPIEILAEWLKKH